MNRVDGDHSGASISVTLPVARYRLRFTPPESAQLRHGYAGSAWRGGFGHALKRTVCVTRERDCPNCLLYRSCVYPYIFETPPPPDAAKMRRYTAAPHPFVLAPMDPPETAHGQGKAIGLGLTLVGRANRQLPYFVHALARAGREGIGRGRPPLALKDVSQEVSPGCGEWRTIYTGEGPLQTLPPAAAAVPEPPAGAIQITIRTPLRLKRANKLVRPETFGFSDLFRNLLRRVSMLSYFHTDAPLDAPFAELARASETINLIHRDLTWRDWTRYSSRQGRTMQMGGVVGTVVVARHELDPFWPYLWIGQWVQAGKGTSMGLGGYHIRAASLRDPASRDTRAIMDANPNHDPPSHEPQETP